MNKKTPDSPRNETELNNRFSEQLHQKLDGLVRSLIHSNVDLDYARKQFDRAYIRETLKVNQGNIGHAARAMGVHRNTLSKRIKELKIPVIKNP